MAAQKLVGTPFQPGRSGNPAGRPRSMVRVSETLAAHGKNPIEEILKLLPDLSSAAAAKVWLDLLPYVAAKIKEVPADDDDLVRIQKMSTPELVKHVQQEIPELLKA